MYAELTKRETGYILSFQRASYENIFPSLRLAILTVQEKAPKILFFCDGSISDDDLESMNLMDTYFRVDFQETLFDGGWEYTRIDYPQPIPNILGECIYARKENPPLIRPKRGVLLEFWMDRRTKVCIALRRAMLNNVFPQIRKISAEYDDTTAIIHVFVDGDICDDDKNSLELMKHYFALQFPQEEMVRCELSVEKVLFPEPMPSFKVCVYIRKEIPNYK